MTVIERVKARTEEAAVQSIATDIEATVGAATEDKHARTPMLKECSPFDGHDNKNGLKGGGGEGNPSGRTARPQDHQGLTLAQYARTNMLEVAFLKSLGLADTYYLSRQAVKIPYLDVDGFEVAVQFRISTDGEDGLRWRKGSKPCLYGLWKLGEARDAGYVCLVKGSSDSQILWSQEIPALSLPSAASWKEEWSCHLQGIEKVYVVVEPGKGGEAVKQWLPNSEIRDRAWLVTLEGAKDPSELYLSDPLGFKDKWAAALASALSWQEVERAERAERAKEAWLQCENLAKEPNILDWFEEVFSRPVAGEGPAARLLYLALTSRFLKRPVSIVMKGPSSCGKSFLTEQVLRFFPPSAYYVVTAMSDKALAYSEEPVKQRFMVILEAAGLQGAWASYFVRTLLSEGRISYETVEKTKDGLRPRRIEREGPTGLITTTTEITLHPENETRYFSVEMNDTPEQTRKVNKATAESINEDDTSISDKEIGMFLALQEWLARANHCVVIPYASRLAEMIPPVAVRLRRDFKSLLNLVKAHAILHQASRQLDDRDRIIATVDDYKAVWEIAAPIVSQGVQVTVSPTMRETVEAVRKVLKRGGYGVSLRDVADTLKLDVSSASRRVKGCLKRGYLKNLERTRGRPHKLVLGDPLPDEALVLPDPKSLAEHCGVAEESGGVNSPPPCLELSGSNVTLETEEVL